MAADPGRGPKVWGRGQGARLATAHERWQDGPYEGSPYPGSRIEADDPRGLAKNISEIEALRPKWTFKSEGGTSTVVALIVLILLLLLLGGGGLIAPPLHVLWLLLVIGLVLWVLGFFIRAAEGSRWYYW